MRQVTFLVGDTREPVCAVKAVLAARSRWVNKERDKESIFKGEDSCFKNTCRVFQKMLYTTPSPQRKKEPTTGSNKLRLFLKRSSEPLLNLQNAAEKVYRSNIFKKIVVDEGNPTHDDICPV